MKHFILYTILIACSLTAQAQTDTPFNKKLFSDQKYEFKEAYFHLEEGNDFFDEGPVAYKAALTNYLKAQEFNPNSSELNFKIGICYLKSINKENALTYLEKAFQLNERVDPGIFFYLAEAYHYKSNWNEAIEWYQKFKAQLIAIEDRKNREVVDLQLQVVNKKIQECEYGKAMAANPVRVFIDNIGPTINTLYSEYGVTISADESMMLFTSRRPDVIGFSSKNSIDETTEDIYMSVRDKNGNWGVAKNLGTPINDKGHDATVSLGPDGQYMIMYKDEDGGALFESHLDGEYWTKPELLDKQINSNYHETEAVYSLDRKRIYFVSNKPEDNLGMTDHETGEYTHDIFYCDWDDKKEKWGSPKNMGALINTKYDEIGLYLHPDGKTLFFSSKGHDTMGGYDIFKTVHNEDYDTWSEPENIGYPVNTPDDDVFLIVSANGKHGYYASARTDGFGEKDIYVITFLGAEKQLLLTSEDPLLANLHNPIGEKLIEPKAEMAISQASLLKGRVLDAVTKEPIMAEIELVDNSKNKQVAIFQSNKASGKYLVSLPDGRNYGIAVKHSDYLFHSENFDMPKGNGYQEFEKIIYLKKATVGSKIVLKNIFFDFNKATLRPESTSELERLAQMLKDAPSLKIELGGHTDSKGTDDYNQSLSEKRAKAVVDYLVNTSGIAQSRLTFKGYGEKEPVAPNTTEEGRQLNRRTEFKIIAN
ncbi:OmpA family protein [Flammeovirgaceae bacterium SG7u.111]|nr:OmpA family protein [Flammeovirgaceae bacterium SG7u.132]WPO35270.1 OmpA family protein [Flammeovirgaceae bacterium SG7u.111]